MHFAELQWMFFQWYASTIRLYYLDDFRYSMMSKTLILDNGVSTVKVGFSTDDTPRWGVSLLSFLLHLQWVLVCQVNSGIILASFFYLFTWYSRNIVEKSPIYKCSCWVLEFTFFSPFKRVNISANAWDVFSWHYFRILPNCVVKAKSERKRVYVADEVDECKDHSSLFYLLPAEKGYIGKYWVSIYALHYFIYMCCIYYGGIDEIVFFSSL